MNASRLLEHFDRISEAPDAIPKLRRFILDLAIRGKLVGQDPADEPAGDLLARIRSERVRLAREGAIKKPKASAPPLPDEKLFDIPPSWAWSQLSHVGIVGPRNSPRDELKCSFVPMKLIPAEYGEPSTHEIRPWGDIKSGFTHFAEGDVALAKITPCFENGKSTVFRNLTGGFGAGTTELHVVRPVLVSPDYLLIFIKSPHFIEAGIPKMTGTAGQKRVPTEYLAEAPLPLPPLAEQHRIVAKVDELMALCDRFEVARFDREEKRRRLVVSSTAGVDQALANRAASAAGSAHSHLSMFNQITARPNDIADLRRTVLSASIRGRLVSQDESDEPATVLLGTRVLRLDSEAEPWALPKGWAWSSFALIGDTVGGGTPSKGNPDFWSGTIPWVSPKDMKVHIINDAEDHISDAALGNSAARLIPPGSLLMVVRGMILAHSFPTARTTSPVAINQDMKAVVPFRHGLIDFLQLLSQAIKPEVMRLVLRSTHGTCKLLTEDLFSLPLPIPPLAEQKRIVAKVAELMVLCDQLNAQIAAAQAGSSHLLDAVLHEALDPSRPSAARVVRAG